MYVRRMVAGLAVAAAALALPTPSQAAAPPSAEQTDGWIVVLDPGTSSSARPTIHARGHDLDVDRVFSHAVRGYSAQLNRGQVAKLRRDPAVLAVEPDVRVWAVAQYEPTGLDRVTLPDTPGLTPSATTVDGVDDRVDADIAVIDTGVGPHPDLNVVMRTNCVSNKCADGVGIDDNGHGTHVGGSAAALDNGFGVVGVAPGARLWSVKVLNASGTGTMSALVAGIDWVTARSDTIDVANLSIVCNCVSLAADNALARANAAGVTVVVAAGNSSVDASPYSIGNSPHVITTSALADFNGVSGGGGATTCRVDVDDTLADFSNFGAVVDLAAPGVCIRSTYLGAGYADLSGTSMASPHVAGAAAILASDPSYAGNPTAIQARLIADGNPGWVDDSGDGVKEPLLDVSALVPVTVPGAPGLTLAVDNTWVAEGSTGQVTVRASRPLVGGEVIKATLSATSGTATSGKDFGAVTAAKVLLTAGQTEVTVPVQTLTEAVREGVETLTTTLSKVSGAVLADSAATMTIYDTSGQLSLSIGNVTSPEGSAPQAEVRLSEPVPTGSQVTAALKATNGTATSGSDFAPVPNQTLTFGPGAQTVLVPLSFLADAQHELDETFSLALSSIVGARGVDVTATATIIDSQGAIQASVGNAWAAEGNAGTSPLNFDVTLSEPPAAGQVVTVTVKTANSSARSGTDYVAKGSTKLTFLAGETSKPLPVTMLGDTVGEGSETLKLSATAVTGAVLADNLGIGTIANDDGAAPPPAPRTLAIGDADLTETGPGQAAAVLLSLSSPPQVGETVSATVTSTNGTATAGSDYQAVTSTNVVFTAGESTVSAPVTALSDDLPELTETFTVVVSAVVGAQVADAAGVVRVVSDQPAILASLDDLWLTEGDGGQVSAQVTVQLSQAPEPGQSVSVLAATTAGTATAGSDFTGVPPTNLVFGPGVTARTVALAINGDTLNEGLESFTVALTTPLGLAVDDSAAAVVLVDEEGPVHASFVNAETTEGATGPSASTVTLALSEPVGSGQTFTVKVATSTGGTATPSVDYTSLASTTYTLTAGQTSLEIPVALTGDTAAEQNETVLLTASTPTGGLVLADATSVLTINNDD